MVMESDAEDMGEYKIEASNEFGQASQTCNVTVVCKYSSSAHRRHRYRHRHRRHFFFKIVQYKTAINQANL